MTITLGGKAPKNIYIGDKQAVIMYKGTDIIWSAKFKVGAIIGQAISTADGSGEYDLDSSKAGWTHGSYEGDYANIIYTYPNFPISKLPNGIKLQFWYFGSGPDTRLTNVSVSQIKAGIETTVSAGEQWSSVRTTVRMNGSSLEIITYGAQISLFAITAY